MKKFKIDKKYTATDEVITKNTFNNRGTLTVANKESQPVCIDKNISEFYGVRQVKDVVMFAAFYPGAYTVQVAGDFNAWQPQRNPMLKAGENGVWQLKLHLAPGTYRYRLVVDGRWQQDPHNQSAEPNQYCEFNSVLTVS